MTKRKNLTSKLAPVASGVMARAVLGAEPTFNRLQATTDRWARERVQFAAASSVVAATGSLSGFASSAWMEAFGVTGGGA